MCVCGLLPCQPHRLRPPAAGVSALRGGGSRRAVSGLGFEVWRVDGGVAGVRGWRDHIRNSSSLRAGKLTFEERSVAHRVDVADRLYVGHREPYIDLSVPA